jgi:hypothetical protein
MVARQWKGYAGASGDLEVWSLLVLSSRTEKHYVCWRHLTWSLSAVYRMYLETNRRLLDASFVYGQAVVPHVSTGIMCFRWCFSVAEVTTTSHSHTMIPGSTRRCPPGECCTAGLLDAVVTPSTSRLDGTDGGASRWCRHGTVITQGTLPCAADAQTHANHTTTMHM